MRRGAGGPVKRSSVAVIDEARCIGCTLCIAACPVDAIAGANGLMHTVIEKYCIGCDLCLPPCPVDCIEMVPSLREWTDADVTAARRRARQRKTRLLARATVPATAAGERRSAVAAAIERVQAKRAGKGGPAA
jgi:electron transport complex protein RnfB